MLITSSFHNKLVPLQSGAFFIQLQSSPLNTPPDKVVTTLFTRWLQSYHRVVTIIRVDYDCINAIATKSLQNQKTLYCNGILFRGLCIHNRGADV